MIALRMRSVEPQEGGIGFASGRLNDRDLERAGVGVAAEQRLHRAFGRFVATRGVLDQCRHVEPLVFKRLPGEEGTRIVETSLHQPDAREARVERAAAGREIDCRAQRALRLIQMPDRDLAHPQQQVVAGIQRIQRHGTFGESDGVRIAAADAGQIPGRRKRVRVVRRELERARERGVRAGPIPVGRADRSQLDVRFDQVRRELERALHGRARVGVARDDGRAAVFGVETVRPRKADPGERVVRL